MVMKPICLPIALSSYSTTPCINQQVEFRLLGDGIFPRMCILAATDVHAIGCTELHTCAKM